MIRKYIQNIISESSEEFKEKETELLKKMITKSLVDKKLETPLSRERLVYALKLGKRKNIDTEEIIRDILRKNFPRQYSPRKYRDEIIIKLTKDILNLSSYLTTLAKEYIKYIESIPKHKDRYIAFGLQYDWAERQAKKEFVTRPRSEVWDRRQSEIYNKAVEDIKNYYKLKQQFGFIKK